MRTQDMDHSQRDLVEAIDAGEFPKWTVKIQVMTEEEAKTFRWNPFDLSKVWLHGEFPLIEVGELELNQIPRNHFAHVEQGAFAPTNQVDGIGFSPDRMLQGRILSYPDAARHRLGVNYEQLSVNACPFMTNNYHRDGAMRFDDNGNEDHNYFPNSFGDVLPDESYKEPAQELDSSTADWYERNEGEGDNDHYTQPGELFRKVMSDADRQNLIHNIVGAMSGISGPKRDKIINLQLCHWFRADISLGMAIANGLGIDAAQAMQSQKH
jgi:catalase